MAEPKNRIGINITDDTFSGPSVSVEIPVRIKNENGSFASSMLTMRPVTTNGIYNVVMEVGGIVFAAEVSELELASDMMLTATASKHEFDSKFAETFSDSDEPKEVVKSE